MTSDQDGNDECTRLAANGGRGYYLLCINLSLAISSVEDCAADEARAARGVDNAASDIAMLAANANFLDDSTCSQELDNCLAKSTARRRGSFPSADGGTGRAIRRATRRRGARRAATTTARRRRAARGRPAATRCRATARARARPIRAAAAATATAASRRAAASGNSGGGCSSGGTSSSSGSSCSGNGDSCSSGSSSGCGGSSSSSSSGCGGGSGGSSCGSSSSSSSSSSGCGGGGGSSGGCSVARAEPDARVVLGVSVAWGFLPVPIAALIRRPRDGAKKKKSSAAGSEASL